MEKPQDMTELSTNYVTFSVFFNANRFEKSVTGNIKADCCKFVFV
jgi:hypothetical protein